MGIAGGQTGTSPAPLRVGCPRGTPSGAGIIKRHQEPIQGRHREAIHLRYCDASANAGAGVALSSPERRFSRSR